MKLRCPLPRLILVALACVPPSLGAGPAPRDEISLERIMADPDWIGASPEAPAWSSDGNSILFSRKIPGCEERDLIALPLSGGPERIVGDDGRAALRPWSGIVSRNGLSHAFVRDGDIFVENPTTGQIRQLTRTLEDESKPMFMPSGSEVAYRRGATWLRCNLATGLETSVADLRAEDEPRKPPESTFLREEAERLFDTIRDERRRGDDDAQRERERRTADPSRATAPFYLGKDQSLRDVSLSPSGRHVLVTLGGKSSEDWPKGIMAAQVTASGDTETRPVRAKVGAGESESQRLMLIDLVTRERQDIPFSTLPGIDEDPLKDLRARAAERAKVAATTRKPDEPSAAAATQGKAAHASTSKATPRAVVVQGIAWNKLGTRVALSIFSADNKDRWIAEVDLGKHALRPLHRLHDPAWISWSGNDMGWLGTGEALWFLSEETGWSQLYLSSVSSKRPRQLTFTRQCVQHPSPTRDGRWIYFEANPANAGVFEVHRVDVATGRAEQVTRLGGLNSFLLSPDEAHLLVTHSEATAPRELVLTDSAPGGLARTLTHSTTPEFDAISWTTPRFVDVPSRHGAGAIHARVIVPSGPPPESGRRAVIFIHGAGYLQDAHEGWSDYFREYMFANLLAREGYVVIDPDYRASAGYGRSWRTAIHRNMGEPELDDLEDSIDWLVKEHGVDRERVGAWGGSYGGFLVLMAMFKRPDMLACGAALRPVTDWAHYNHPYTSDILETPTLAPEAYRRSSPIEWASGLSRPLLICAPMLDDNVLFEDSARLVQRLIELGRPTFEIGVYPVEPHTFRQPSSWLDEYRRIHALFERNLSEPGKTRP